jgi:hypothetical protein
MHIALLRYSRRGMFLTDVLAAGLLLAPMAWASDQVPGSRH